MSAEPLLKSELKSLSRVAFITILLFFGVFGGWISLAPLSQGALTTGTVSPDGYRRTVQHLEGGIIQSLLVREGQKVRKGDVLMTLQKIKALSNHSIQKSRLLSQLSEQARLVAEKNHLDTVTFDERLKSESHRPEVLKIMDEQISLFKARRNVDESRRDILSQKIKQFRQQIKGVRKLNISLDQQFSLVEQEIKSVKILLDKGLERKPRLLSLKRVQAQIIGRNGENDAQIARSLEEIASARLEIIQLDLQRQDEVGSRLSQLRAEISETEQTLLRSRDALKRTTLRAPVDGIIMNSRFKTIGGVVQPGDEVLDIVPMQEKLFIEAKVSPYDIDMVQTGASAMITLSAYPQRTTPRLTGLVEWVSADVKTESDNKKPYYSARISIAASDLKALPDIIVLYPGMPVETVIRSREITMLDYLIDPLLSSVRRSFIEG